MMNKKTIKVLDFTEYPGPRYIRQDKVGGNNSGEAFYVHCLNKEFKECYEKDMILSLELDGVSGYPSSFLDEAIGELVYDFSRSVVEKYLDYDTFMYKKRVQQVINETYPQWEERREKGTDVVHSDGINKIIYYLNTDKKIEERLLG